MLCTLPPRQIEDGPAQEGTIWHVMHKAVVRNRRGLEALLGRTPLSRYTLPGGRLKHPHACRGFDEDHHPMRPGLLAQNSPCRAHCRGHSALELVGGKEDGFEALELLWPVQVRCVTCSDG
jgi:hypothetical protein